MSRCESHTNWQERIGEAVVTEVHRARGWCVSTVCVYSVYLQCASTVYGPWRPGWGSQWWVGDCSILNLISLFLFSIWKPCQPQPLWFLWALILFICLLKFYRLWGVEFYRLPGDIKQAPGLLLVLWSPCGNKHGENTPPPQSTLMRGFSIQG